VGCTRRQEAIDGIAVDAVPWIHPDGHRWSAVTERADQSGETVEETGLVRIRTGLVGVGLIWLTAVATVGAVVAAAHGLTGGAIYLPVAVLAAAIAIAAGAASLRTFGYR
jgi:hypothetical protein